MRVVNKRTATAPEPHVIRVYIGRPSPLGNPFQIGKDGTRDQVISKYCDFIRDQIAADSTAASSEFNRLKRLLDDDRGRVIELECWCEPQPCHGDVLRNLLQPKITFAVVDPPSPQPVENYKRNHRRLAIEQLMEHWHDLSDDEQHDWALDWLERSTDEELNSDCRNAFCDQ